MRSIFAMIGLFVVTIIFMVSKMNAKASEASTYWHSQKYAVSLYHPSDWKVTADDDSRLEGEDGYVQIWGAHMDKPDLHQLCESEAQHVLKPFGFFPKVTYQLVDGQGSCFIYPSAEVKKDSMGNEMIVYLPRAVTLSSGTYNFLVLIADHDHFDEVTSSVRFDRPAM